MLRRSGVGRAFIDVEARTFVRHFDDQHDLIHPRPDAHPFAGIVRVAVKDRVRERLSQCDGHVEHELAGGVLHELAFPPDEIHDALDLSDVVDLELDGADVPRAAGRSGSSTLAGAPRGQKLWSARSRVSAIWNSVS